MSFYFNWEDLIGKYRKVSQDWDASYANSNWIPAACAELDGYLGAAYTVPFTPVPPIVKDLAIDLCYYKMTWTDEKAGDLKDYIDSRIEQIINKTLTIQSSGSTIANAPQVFLTTSGYPSSFGMDAAERWRVSSDWQQAYSSDRGDLY